MLADPDVIRFNQWPHHVALSQATRRSCRYVGLATMSYCPQVQRVLQNLELTGAFDFVASRDDVEHELDAHSGNRGTLAWQPEKAGAKVSLTK